MSWLSLLPPLLAISIAIIRKEVILALLSALFLAELILAGGNPFTALLQSIEALVSVFSSSDNTRILMFSLLIGALLALIRLSDGVSAFIQWLLNSGLARGPRSVSVLTCLLGVAIFIESNLSILTCGTFAQNLFDRFGLSRARLALLVDTTCSPVSVLILLNGWGAFILGLLENQPVQEPVAIMLATIPLNFYAIIILVFAFYTAGSGKVFSSLAAHERQQPETSMVKTEAHGKIRYFLLPLLTMVAGIIGFMFYTGAGELIAGSGSSSALYAIVLAVLVCYLLLLFDNKASHATMIKTSFSGMGELLPVVTILLLAFALGSAMGELQTGAYIASHIPAAAPAWILAPAVFLAACIISFTTGTSWGTFGILIPVVIPLAIATDAPPSLILAAVLSGGVFGDHCSPISDSTVLSSLASGCEHLTHVRTQLPYSLTAGAISILLFTVAGFIAG